METLLTLTSAYMMMNKRTQTVFLISLMGSKYHRGFEKQNKNTNTILLCACHPNRGLDLTAAEFKMRESFSPSCRWSATCAVCCQGLC